MRQRPGSTKRAEPQERPDQLQRADQGKRPEADKRRQLFLTSHFVRKWLMLGGSFDGAPMNIEVVTTTGIHRFDVEVAADEAARRRGLMGRSYIAPNHGMLILFDRPAPHPIWTKDTPVPLDVVFLLRGAATKVVHSAPPNSERLIAPGGPCDAALELNAGTAVAINLAVGDVVREATV